MVSLFLVFYISSYHLSKRMGCLYGCLVSSASVQKLFCGSCSQHSNDLLMTLWGEKWSPRPVPPVCRSRSNSQKWTWNNSLVPNWERSMSRLYIVTLLIYLYAEYIMRNTGLDEAQAGIKIAGRNINNLRYADDTTLMAESEGLKSLLMKLKEESEKVGLKLKIQKMKVMASGPITSWQK